MVQLLYLGPPRPPPDSLVPSEDTQDITDILMAVIYCNRRTQNKISKGKRHRVAGGSLEEARHKLQESSPQELTQCVCVCVPLCSPPCDPMGRGDPMAGYNPWDLSRQECWSEVLLPRFTQDTLNSPHSEQWHQIQNAVCHSLDTRRFYWGLVMYIPSA